MKIAYYLNRFPTLSETFILNQIVGMIQRGNDVDIYARKPGDDPKVHPDVTTYRLMERVRHTPTRPRNYPLRLLKAGALALREDRWRRPLPLARALNIRKYGREAGSLRLVYAALPPLGRNEYDVIHAQYGTLGLKALALRQIGALSGRLVTSFRGFDAFLPIKGHPDLYDELFREGDLFLPVSRSLARRLVENGCEESKIIVHPSGIDCSRFQCSPRLRKDDQPTRILSVSRLVEKKGLHYAIEAVSRLVDSGRKISYTIVGDGELRSDLEDLIAKLGMTRQVNLMGWRSQDEIAACLKNAHLLVAPSVTAADGDQEGIPNSLKEAMAMGLPVVSTRHGGIPELIEHGVSGWLVPERDTSSLAERLAYLHDHPETWIAMGLAGRAKVESDFDIHKLNEELTKLYAREKTESLPLAEAFENAR